MTNRERIIQSTVRTILSLGGHAGAIATIYYSTTNNGGKPLFTVPDWLPALFALVITWYFATKEATVEGQEARFVPPAGELYVRATVYSSRGSRAWTQPLFGS